MSVGSTELTGAEVPALPAPERGMSVGSTELTGAEVPALPAPERG
jgi:hypothetical protein